jgi:hypothetical protein
MVAWKELHKFKRSVKNQEDLVAKLKRLCHKYISNIIRRNIIGKKG